MKRIVGISSGLSGWFAERLPVERFTAYLRKKEVPRHRYWIWYLFGGLTLFFLITQIVTGILLSLNYTADPEHAHESVRRIVNELPHGWLIRSIHSWSANLLIACALVHMFSVFFMKSYRKPRELMWVSGLVLMFLLLGFGFTGYLLPWDTTAYFATLIGTEVPGTVPIIGDWGLRVLKGASDIGRETLARMYTIHTIVLPLTALFFVGLHLVLGHLLGASVPIGVAEKYPRMKFFPNFLYRDLVAWLLGLALLVTLSTILPRGLEEKANPFASAPAGIRPEWYFLPLFQSLRMVPASVLSVSGDFIVNLGVLLGSAFWFLVPFIDRKAMREQKGRMFTAIGVLVLAYYIGTIAIAYVTT